MTDAILITGPTASGKSALAVELAQRHGGEVINADSMQVYDTLQVLTARPLAEDMGGIVHHLYGSVPAATRFSTGDWLRGVTPVVARVRQAGRVPVIVGGTGLYFRALTGGLAEMPEIDPGIRAYWRERLIAEGPAVLHDVLRQRDPESAARLDIADGQRIARALEVLDASGMSILAFQQQAGRAVIPAQSARKIIVLPDRGVLHARINCRFAKMLDTGAVEETERLLGLGLSPDMTIMKAIGVTQIAEMLAGRMTRESVIERASAATRQYAKRQMTWFRNQMDDSWSRLT